MCFIMFYLFIVFVIVIFVFVICFCCHFFTCYIRDKKKRQKKQYIWRKNKGCVKKNQYFYVFAHHAP